MAGRRPCLPVQRGMTPVGAWVVLGSLRGNSSDIVADADTIVGGTVLLAGVHPAETPTGAPVANYLPSLHNLALRFPAPYAPSVYVADDLLRP